MIETDQESYFRRVSKFVKKSENETKPFPCDACEQTFEKKLNMKEHINTNNVEFIEVLETKRLKLNEDKISSNFVKKKKKRDQSISLSRMWTIFKKKV